MIDKKFFYTRIKDVKLISKISQKQVESLDSLLSKWDVMGDGDVRKMAYVLGTVYHETAGTMLPIEEFGQGVGRSYGTNRKMSGEVYEHPDKFYYGRGYVQLTWYENYDGFGKVLDIPLLEQPELALDVNIAGKIAIMGMTRGMFTGRKLSQYFNGSTEDWVNARRIINGLDKAPIVAKYSKAFYQTLKKV